MKTEKEKMISGELYNPACPILTQDRINAQNKCFELNQLSPTKTAERNRILKSLFNQFGDESAIMPYFGCDYGYNITVGHHFFANFNCIMLDAAPITFGNHVLIGPNCGFYTSGHPLDTHLRNSGLEDAKPITIGNNVWFGGNVVVLPGITIGDNCVIAAGSIVTKSIPSNNIAMGNPCRIRT